MTQSNNLNISFVLLSILLVLAVGMIFGIIRYWIGLLIIIQGVAAPAITVWLLDKA